METIEDLVILGGGTAGWMAAAALSKALQHSNIRIQLIESEDIGTVGVGEATVPDIVNFNTMLGLDQADFMRQCQATFKLGIEFVNWGAAGHRYMHAFTGYGLNPGKQQFHRLWQKYAARRRAMGEACHLDDYNLGILAAYNNRFAPVSKAAAADAGPLGYAFHFDANLYARYLRGYAEERGVRRIAGKAIAVEQSDDGLIRSISLESGQDIGGDFFIDCSGFSGLLIEKTLKTGYTPWTHWLPCNRAVAVPSQSGEPPEPYTRSTADIAGWMWRIPLQSRVGNGYVYSSEFLTDEAAETRLLAQLGGQPLASPRRLQFITGKRNRVWNGNCLALGLAAGFLEPLESTSIHLIQTSIFRFLSLFPQKRPAAPEIDAFNRQTDEEYENVRDFIIAHYKLTRRADTPFWLQCRDMEVPDRVRHIIDVFAENGRLALRPEHLFSTHSWLAILYGQAEWPRGYDPLLASIPDEDIDVEMQFVRQRVRQVMRDMPQHAHFIDEMAKA